MTFRHRISWMRIERKSNGDSAAARCKHGTKNTTRDCAAHRNDVRFGNTTRDDAATRSKRDRDEDHFFQRRTQKRSVTVSIRPPNQRGDAATTVKAFFGRFTLNQKRTINRASDLGLSAGCRTSFHRTRGPCARHHLLTQESPALTRRPKLKHCRREGPERRSHVGRPADGASSSAIGHDIFGLGRMARRHCVQGFVAPLGSVFCGDSLLIRKRRCNSGRERTKTDDVMKVKGKAEIPCSRKSLPY